MKQRYIRFVVGTEREDDRLLDGVFTISRCLRGEGRLYRHEERIVSRAFDWFNEHLPCPPFGANIRSGSWTRDARAWFRPEARECISKIWNLIHILKEHGEPVTMLQSDKPGKIVYRDRYQIVAESTRMRGR